MAEHMTRVPIEQAVDAQLANVHIIGAVGRGDDSHRYVELMSDLQHLPMGIVEEDGGGGIANVLLVEVDDPNDSECLREAIEILARHEHFEQRRHCFKQF